MSGEHSFLQWSQGVILRVSGLALGYCIIQHSFVFVEEYLKEMCGVTDKRECIQDDIPMASLGELCMLVPV